MSRRITVGKRIALGFAVVMGLLALVATFSFGGIRSMAGSVNDAIAKNQLIQALTEREIDHLNWANRVNALLTDENITELAVETDDHKCRFGQWLFGPEREAAEAMMPEIAERLKEIESHHAALHASAIEIGKAFKRADPLLPEKLRAREVDHLVWSEKVNQLFVKNLPKLEVQVDPTQCGLGKWLASDEAKHAARDPEFAKRLEALREPHQRLHQSAVEIQQVWRPRHPGLDETLRARLDDHRRWAAAVSRACIAEDADLKVQTDPTKCAFGEFLASEQCQHWCAEFPELKAALDACGEPHRHLHESAVKIKQALAAGKPAEARQVYATETVAALEKVAEHFEAAIAAEAERVAAQKQAAEIYETQTLPALAQTRAALGACQEYAIGALHGMQQANQVFSTKTKPALAKVQEILGNIRETVRTEVITRNAATVATGERTKVVTLFTGAVAMVAGVLLAWLIARSIVRALQRVIAQLNDGADQVSDAAGQLSSASQQLAEGASEQASSLEETSSALEQMAAMTRTNAENSQKADGLTRQARDAADQGSTVVAELNQAMQGISDASQQISKILKVIEEIAFQTNLLALNAAVEAARAGEHGKGFAVVAEEVRNLAQRAGGAAKEISDLIANSTQRSQEGVKIAENVGTSLGGILTNVKNVSDLVNGIAKGSQEQAQGVEQINIAVSQMDKVTQQNAAGAEEAASASEELAAQAQTLKAMVTELLALVQGDHGDRGNAGPSPTNYNPAQPAKKKTAKPATHFAHLHKTATAHAAASASGHGGAAEDNPEYEPAPTAKDSSGGLSAF